LEYKSTLCTAASTGEVVKPLEAASVKTVAAFGNSPDEGTLLIGVADDGSVHGLASGYAALHKDGKERPRPLPAPPRRAAHQCRR